MTSGKRLQSRPAHTCAPTEQKPGGSEMNLNSKPSALLSLLGVMLLWPYVLTKSVSSSDSLSAGLGDERPHVVKRSTQNCESSYDKYCLNNGQCMLLVDMNKHYCKCERGYSGLRCGDPELVFQPQGEEQIIVTIFCVSLLIIGLSGALYFCCKWYKKNKFPCQQKRLGYKGVQTA
ncbi:proepiregulin [Larimichthys crocea]|uniref:proepiregulin n=1 Tax=Larimichthys crocea TaxID=215358 RepID=UPI000901BEB3|nr:proepiregulin [Larimichthys crocea]